MKSLFQAKSLLTLTLVTLTGALISDPCRISAAQPTAISDQISRQRIFVEPILWVGDQPPAEAESAALSRALEAGKNNRTTQRILQLEEFVGSNPDSAWTPSVCANLA